MTRTNAIIQKTAQMFFLLVFPGLFFYSSAVASGSLPAVFGGGYGLFAGLAFIFLFPSVLLTLPQLRGVSLALALCVFALLFYVSIWVIIYFFLGDSFSQRGNVISHWASLLIGWASLFSIGYFWPKQCSRSFKNLLMFIVASIFVVVLLNIEPSHLIYRLGIAEHNNTLSYQGISRSAAITGLILVAVVRNQYLGWLFMALVLIAVFLIGARSELVGVVLVLPILIYYSFMHKPVRTIASVFVIIVVASTIVTMSYDVLSLSRQAQLFDISQSTSGVVRLQLQSEALQAIVKNPLFGDFSGQVRMHNNFGYYAHNFLSSWRQLGIIGFLVYLVLLTLPVIITLYRIVKRPSLLSIDIIRIAGVLSVYMLVLALGAKSIFWPFIALSWGIFVSAHMYLRAGPREFPMERRAEQGIGPSSAFSTSPRRFH